MRIKFIPDDEVEVHITNDFKKSVPIVIKSVAKALRYERALPAKRPITGLLDKQQQENEKAAAEIVAAELEDSAPKVPVAPVAKVTKRRRSSSRHKEGDLVGPADTYFVQRHSKANTSMHTLADTGMPSGKQIEASWDKVEDTHAAEKRKLKELYRTLYNKWLLYLQNGFNLLFHGVGSKKAILDDFAKQCSSALKKGAVEVLGYEVTLTSKIVAETLAPVLEEETPSIIVAHNIDGPGLRSPKCQNMLLDCARTDGVHILASIDHINASLLWDSAKLAQFKWLYIDATTFTPYTIEARGRSLAVSGAISGGAERAAAVLRAMTLSGKQTFLLLASKGADGLTQSEWYHKSRDRMYISSEKQLRDIMVELKDHELLKLRQGRLIVPLSADNVTRLRHDLNLPEEEESSDESD